jgi:hypothetical protein
MITKAQALVANRFCHLQHKNADGSAVRARRNGKTMTWVTRPDEWSIPVVYGLRGYFYINDKTAHVWRVAGE